MDRHVRGVTSVLSGGLVLALVCTAPLRAQKPVTPSPTELTNIQHNSGQPVIPYFEGWIKNTDGTFDMVFGYFNRNYVEEFSIPPGPENKVEPGAADQGQPSYFVTRRQRYVYRVRVPADFGKKEVVWTITANGRPERAFGNLLPEQEITDRVVMTNGDFDPGLGNPNQPPAITVAPVTNVTAGTLVSLTASVADDGLPKPRVVVPRPSNPTAATGGFGAQVNSSEGRGPRPVSVSWLQYSGPGKVEFERATGIRVTDGKAITTARFPAPGKYRLVATASDPGRLSSKVVVDVSVTGGQSMSPRQ